MCMQCNTDPSPTCWGACARANPKKSLIDSAVMPFCMDCAKNPTNECWTACHRAAKLVKKIESPANYCMQCDTDPSPTCWGACAATIPEPQPRCMQCDTDPSPTCWGACAKAGVMVDYEGGERSGRRLDLTMEEGAPVVGQRPTELKIFPD